MELEGESEKKRMNGREVHDVECESDEDENVNLRMESERPG